MAAPLTKEDREKIVDYLKSMDLSELTGNQIKELIKENLGISVSQPTASKLKGDMLEDTSGDGEFIEDGSSLEHTTSSEEIGAIAKPIESDKIRQLSQEQQNAIDHMLHGKSDRAVADAVGVSRQTVWEWRKKDILFIAELNRQRSEMWSEAHERLKSLANRALDVLDSQLENTDPKASLAAARYVLQGTRMLGDTNLPSSGPTTPEALLMQKLRSEARAEIRAKYKHSDLELFGESLINEEDVEARAKSKLKKALEEAGLA